MDIRRQCTGTHRHKQAENYNEMCVLTSPVHKGFPLFLVKSFQLCFRKYFDREDGSSQDAVCLKMLFFPARALGCLNRFPFFVLCGFDGLLIVSHCCFDLGAPRWGICRFIASCMENLIGHLNYKGQNVCIGLNRICITSESPHANSEQFNKQFSLIRNF